MPELIGALQELGELHYWRISPAGPPHGNQDLPAVVVFRFKSSAEHHGRILESAISSFHGEIGWHIFSSMGSWVLEPRRVIDLAAERGRKRFEEARRLLLQEAPEFGRQSNRELVKLAEHLRTVIRSASEAGRLTTQAEQPQP